MVAAAVAASRQAPQPQPEVAPEAVVEVTAAADEPEVAARAQPSSPSRRSRRPSSRSIPSLPLRSPPSRRARRARGRRRARAAEPRPPSRSRRGRRRAEAVAEDAAVRGSPPSRHARRGCGCRGPRARSCAACRRCPRRRGCHGPRCDARRSHGPARSPPTRRWPRTPKPMRGWPWTPWPSRQLGLPVMPLSAPLGRPRPKTVEPQVEVAAAAEAEAVAPQVEVAAVARPSTGRRGRRRSRRREPSRVPLSPGRARGPAVAQEVPARPSRTPTATIMPHRWPGWRRWASPIRRTATSTISPTSMRRGRACSPQFPSPTPRRSRMTCRPTIGRRSPPRSVRTWRNRSSRLHPRRPLRPLPPRRSLPRPRRCRPRRLSRGRLRQHPRHPPPGSTRLPRSPGQAPAWRPYGTVYPASQRRVLVGNGAPHPAMLSGMSGLRRVHCRRGTQRASAHRRPALPQLLAARLRPGALLPSLRAAPGLNGRSGARAARAAARHQMVGGPDTARSRSRRMRAYAAPYRSAWNT